MAIFVVFWYSLSLFTTTHCLFFAHDCQMTNMTTRQNTCPPGSCCVKDPTEPEVYCKPQSDEGGPCYAADPDWPASCPCQTGLKCVPNLQVPTWTSTYGRCQRNATAA